MPFPNPEKGNRMTTDSPTIPPASQLATQVMAEYSSYDAAGLLLNACKVAITANSRAEIERAAHGAVAAWHRLAGAEDYPAHAKEGHRKRLLDFLKLLPMIRHTNPAMSDLRRAAGYRKPAKVIRHLLKAEAALAGGADHPHVAEMLEGVRAAIAGAMEAQRLGNEVHLTIPNVKG
ncbi:MAG: hypothetical protein HQL39_18525 [Alphaproteobacteria bacterium]|nr:hypothetical protein [Alphaproteobacteria bacterium]